MLKWIKVMALYGGSGPRIKYGAPFFHWLRDQLLMVNDYAYTGTGFPGDSDLALPEGEQWGDLGKKDTIMHVFYIFMILCFLCVILR